ncbi:hypothetical protein SAMN06265219_108189 [Gracilimonas mengyeensis]|uniref:DUF4402 domain-containing protein n=2 Tax=Gracilimonas mengyeensis TaxID=1302730 RepID=A0A521DI72_9BACT|nr:hypothetical protein SAMN06265219_108189 [Gracilimonas mengyeensis]
MREIIKYIFFLILVLLTSVAEAQVTAVMQAKVNIISGAGLTSLTQPNIELSENSFGTERIEAGRFSFVASPGAEVSVSISKVSKMVNNQGHHVTFKPSLIHNTDAETGKHHIIMKGLLNSESTPKGQYSGQLTAVIEYL